MIRTAKVLITLAMVIALAMPVMAQVNITETIDCDVCNLSKCKPVDLGCVKSASQTTSAVCPLWGDAYQVEGLLAGGCIDTTEACTSSDWWNVTAGNYANRPNGSLYNIYCPVIFDICNCVEAVESGVFSAETYVGIELTIVTKTAGGSYVKGDNGVYFGELYSGNVIMSNNRDFLCNPTCAVAPAAVNSNDAGIVYPDGSSAWRIPSVNTFWRFDNSLGTAAPPSYWLANGNPGTVVAPVCAPGSTNKVVKITTDYVMQLTEVDEDRGLSRWALDIPTIYVTQSYTQCTTIGVEILVKTDLGGTICADCRTECICIEDLYTTCCDVSEESTSECLTFNYFAKLDGSYANGLVIINPSNTESVNVDLTLYEKDGDVGTYSLNSPIAPNGMYITLVDNVAWQGSGVGDSQCYVVAEGDGLIDGFGYFWDEEGHSMGYQPRTYCIIPSSN